MKIDYIKCDRCGNFDEKTKIYDGHMTVRRFAYWKHEDTGYEKFIGRTLDLCKDCEKSLIEWISGGKT